MTDNHLDPNNLPIQPQTQPTPPIPNSPPAIETVRDNVLEGYQARVNAAIREINTVMNVEVPMPGGDHIPDGLEFAGDPTLARQSSIIIELPESVAVVGVGGVGSWIAYFLALAGVPRLYLFDSDTVSETNLNRVPYGATVAATVQTVGMPKTQALKAFMLERRPHLKVECHPNFTPAFGDALNLARETRWMACSTDSWQSRRDTHQWTEDNGVRYIEAAAEGDVGSIAAAPAEFTTELESAPGYASVPVWVGPCVSAAAMACSHILHQKLRGDENARLGWDGEQARMVLTSHTENPAPNGGQDPNPFGQDRARPVRQGTTWRWPRNPLPVVEP